MIEPGLFENTCISPAVITAEFQIKNVWNGVVGEHSLSHAYRRLSPPTITYYAPCLYDTLPLCTQAWEYSKVDAITGHLPEAWRTRYPKQRAHSLSMPSYMRCLMRPASSSSSSSGGNIQHTRGERLKKWWTSTQHTTYNETYTVSGYHR